MRRKAVVVATFLLLHLLTVFVVCLRETFWVASVAKTLLPPEAAAFAGEGEILAKMFLLEDKSSPSWAREVLATGRHLTGSEASYGFFAPNVGGSYQLAFSFDYPEGGAKLLVPAAKSRAAAIRLDSLLAEIGRTSSDKYREGLIRKVAAAAWAAHPEATRLRAVLGVLDFPDSGDFAAGAEGGYRPLYKYELVREPRS